MLGSNEKIRRLTGWQPEYTLKQGIRESIEWFRDEENLRRYKWNVIIFEKIVGLTLYPGRFLRDEYPCKRSELIKHIKKHDAVIVREGGRLSLYQRGE